MVHVTDETNDDTVPVVVCRLCRRPLELVSEGVVMLHFRPCPRHPGFRSRYNEETGEMVQVPHKIAANDKVTVGVMRSALARPHRGPYAV